MENQIEATIYLCDAMNPDIGYQVKITKREETIFFSSVAPDTGESMLTFSDAVRVVNMYK